jgi:hypothetical protein
MKRQKYVVRSTIKHNGEVYIRGDIIELTANEGSVLEEVVKLAKNQSKKAKASGGKAKKSKEHKQSKKEQEVEEKVKEEEEDEETETPADEEDAEPEVNGKPVNELTKRECAKYLTENNVEFDPAAKVAILQALVRHDILKDADEDDEDGEE